MVALSCRTPMAAVGIRWTDSASLVGEIVADSDAVVRTLTTLVESLPPTGDLSERARYALTAAAEVADLRPDWVAYRNRTAGLSPDATDPRSDMCRTWVLDDDVRAWPRYSEARTAVNAAVEALLPLGQELAARGGPRFTTRNASPVHTHPVWSGRL
ncbi:hypothetical protein [Streptomyces sp. CC208A]|uniref:hypothetical protein n=1 Tax=Streptomyces sp. CC208A TaxID=3044573 RepID=UPI0024A7C290|nr:hypothetical protein [Streptomyces sp. CC208A]